ncbi:MAG: hypothetical protein JOZ22_21575 [Acidobacteriia bacterium]|nr:hypothetical protein [Terriglobia bacterium]
MRVYRFITESPASPLIVFGLAVLAAHVLRLGRFRIPWVGLAAVFTAARIIAAATYVFLPIALGDTETDVACISALALRGLPVYPAPDAASRYHMVYGPLTYLAHVPIYPVLGASLVSFKLLGFFACLLSIVALYRICRKYAPPRICIVGIGAASLVLFRYLGIDFHGRSDPLILCVVAVCTLIVLDAPAWGVALAGAIALGLIPNFKVSGFAYLLPIFGLIVIRNGWRMASIAAALGALLLPLPFILPNVSLADYAFILKVNENHGLSADLLLRNAQYSIIMLAPVLAVAFSRRNKPWPSRAQMSYLTLTVCGMGMSSVVGAKIGAGSYHLVPYIVPLLHLYFWMRNESVPPADADYAFKRFAIAWTVAMLVYSVTRVQVVLGEFEFAPSGRRVISEIRHVKRTYPGRTLEIGIGRDFYDRRTRYSYVTTFDGQPYTLSGSAIRDLQFGGVGIPDATVRYIEDCQTQIWLIPKRQSPFTATNPYYSSYHPAFDERFRRAFLAHYNKIDSGELFDVWSCVN